jgi:multimeric flavodoxin WrbA
MKVCAILGSPREKGVTSTIANVFMSEAGKMGADTATYFLNSMDFQGCQGCMVCKTKKEFCILKDDLTPALEDIHSADIVVFATPVYYWDVTGQFKSFFDRTWSFVKPDYKTNPNPVRLAKGKKALFVTSQGDIEEKHQDVIKKYSGFLSMYGFETQALRAFDMSETKTNELDAYLTKAKNIAGNML